jgi:hypothetical protein
MSKQACFMLGAPPEETGRLRRSLISFAIFFVGMVSFPLSFVDHLSSFSSHSTFLMGQGW